MRNVTASSLIAAAALAALTSSSFAQYRVGDQGHANDANNRIGSGGYNAPNDVSQRSLGVTNSQILTGNSTGLSYFHGNSQIFDPNNIQANTQTGASDTLNAIAAPQNLTARTTNAPQFNTVRPFYSTAQVNQLPAPNYVQTPGGVGLVPAPAQSQQANDLRMGVITPVTTGDQLPMAGQLNLPGQVDNSATYNSLNASPMTGIRQLNGSDPNDSYFMSRYTNTEMQTRGQGLDNAAIQRMRNELNSTVVDQNGQQPGDDRTQFNNNPNNAAQPSPQGNAINNQRLPTAMLNQPNNAPNNAALPNQALGANLSQSAVSGNLDTAQGTRQTLLTLPPPREQSSQLAELEKRMTANKGSLTDKQANQNYNEAQRLIKQSKDEKDRKAAIKPGASTLGGDSGPGNGTVPVTPGDTAKPAFNAPPTVEKPADKTTPPLVNGPLTDQSAANGDYVVTSLSTGIKAAGLAKVMKSAEGDMRSGKFTSALDSYDTAAAVAPNNPFVTLGRGFAELGASYYGKSEGDLRRTIATEPAVLVGRYDLKGFLGEDRVRFVSGDLRDIAKSEKTQVRPLFLLAYIEHNLGDDQTATADLIEAQKRAGGSDTTITQMQKLWGLPTK